LLSLLSEFMFLRSEYAITSVRVDYRSWGPDITHNLKDIIDKRTSASFHMQSSLRHKNDNDHICFGSTIKDSTVVFRIKTDSDNVKHEMFLTLGLGYLHSWNQSYVGDAECQLFRSDPQCTEFREAESNKVVLVGNSHLGSPVRDTTPRESIIAKATITAGCHLLRCRNIDGRLSCFTR
jgi:hypothetical protein